MFKSYFWENDEGLRDNPRDTSVASVAVEAHRRIKSGIHPKPKCLSELSKNVSRKRPSRMN